MDDFIRPFEVPGEKKKLYNKITVDQKYGGKGYDERW